MILWVYFRQNLFTFVSQNEEKWEEKKELTLVH